MIQGLIALALICLLEGIVVYFAIKQMKVLKGQVKASTEAVAAARRELEGAQGLLNKQKAAREDAKNEQERLEDTPDTGLAGRANSLFDS
jgi:hypothetical protein